MVELIAHRAGNSRRGAESVPASSIAVEADVHLHRGQVEVRHAKRIWGTSRLWERWYLLPRGTDVPLLPEALTWVRPEVPLWIDGKGASRRLPTEVVGIAADRLPITLSTKAWWILRAVSGRPDVRAVRSAGNRFELLLLRYLPSRLAIDGVVVHRRLLDGPLVAALRRRYGLVFTWSVDDIETAHRLISWGVDGLIVDAPELLQALVDAGVEADHPGRDDDR